MKKLFHLLLLSSLFLSCSKDENACTINGRYYSAPDGMVLYVTPVDDILSPIDSAIVRNGKFSLVLSDTLRPVCFISSQQVIDGNFVVLEPGEVDVDFTGETFVGGTPANDCLNRFMVEKDKIVNLRRMCEPESLDMLAVEESMRDSVRSVVQFANEVFDMYALNEIRANITEPLGCFFLLQSVGIVPSAKLLPFFDKVPVEHRGKLYDAVKKRVEAEASDAAMAARYLQEVEKGMEATSVGKKFQNFELDNVRGGKVLLSDVVFADRYTLVLFWAGWQEGIKEQLAVLSSAYGRYKASGLQVVGVSLDSDVDVCKALADELSISWLQLCNPSGGSAEVAAAYGVATLPAAVLVNKKGTVIARMSTVEEVLKKFEELF